MNLLDIDTSNGVLLPFYDPDTNVVYLCGKVTAPPGANSLNLPHCVFRRDQEMVPPLWLFWFSSGLVEFLMKVTVDQWDGGGQRQGHHGDLDHQESPGLLWVARGYQIVTRGCLGKPLGLLRTSSPSPPPSQLK